jgi:hypothetical protein
MRLHRQCISLVTYVLLVSLAYGQDPEDGDYVLPDGIKEELSDARAVFQTAYGDIEFGFLPGVRPLQAHNAASLSLSRCRCSP